MLEALIAGETDPAAMADLAKRRMRSKIPALTQALTGRFTPHHGYLIRMHLNLIDSYTTALSDPAWLARTTATSAAASPATGPICTERVSRCRDWAVTAKPLLRRRRPSSLGCDQR